MAAEVPYSVQLDPDSARNLATHGASILLLGVPLGTPVGFDQQIFLTGPRFKGMKMLPPGVHFLSYQTIGKDGSLSPPVSTFLHLKSKQVYVRKWDAAAEGLVPLEDEDEEQRYAAGVARFDFDQELAPYDLNRYSQWTSLSYHISQDVLQEILPVDGEISIMCEESLLPVTTAAEQHLQQQLEEGRARLQSVMHIDQPADIPEQQQSQQQPAVGGPNNSSSSRSAPSRGGRCHYTQLPRLLKVHGTTAGELTSMNLDKTRLLEQALQRYSSSSSSTGGGKQSGSPVGGQLLGELQLAFIAFMFGQSLEGYLQWKQLLILFLGCISGPLDTHTELFIAFLTTVIAQLRMGFSTGANGGAAAAATAAVNSSTEAAAAADAGAAMLGAGLVDELLPDSFLKQAFRGFFEVLQESADQAPAGLLAQARVLESLLAAELGWDFRLKQLRLGSDDEDDEDGPVVVELSEQQLAELEGAS